MGEDECLHQGKWETSQQVWMVAEHPPTRVSVKARESILRDGLMTLVLRQRVESYTINTGTSTCGRSKNSLMGTTGKNQKCP